MGTPGKDGAMTNGRIASIFSAGVVTITLLLLASCGSSGDDNPERGSSSILDAFYAYDGAEDTLMDPLIVAGAAAVPTVSEAIRDPGMLKRRYAIGALGNIGDRRAIPSLTEIALDVSEVEYVRCDCVQAIALIDWEEGTRVASLIAGNSNHAESGSFSCLARVTRGIVEGDQEDWLSNLGMVRSLEDAKARRHN